MIQTSTKTAMPTRLVSVVTMTTIAHACRINAMQRAVIPPQPIRCRILQLTKILDALQNTLNACSN
jgi:hypothetical protein